MNADTLQIISWIGFGSAALSVISAVILYIRFDIPSVMNELSGRTARKQVQELREQNKKAVLKRQTLAGYEARAKINTEHVPQQTEETTPLGTEQQTEETTPLGAEQQSEETTLLGGTWTEQSHDKKVNHKFVIAQNVVEIHTNEMI